MKRRVLVVLMTALIAVTMAVGSAGAALADTPPAQATQGLQTGAAYFEQTRGYDASAGSDDGIQCGDQLDEYGNPLPDQNCDNDPSEPA